MKDVVIARMLCQQFVSHSLAHIDLSCHDCVSLSCEEMNLVSREASYQW